MSIIMYICLGMFGPSTDDFTSYLTKTCEVVMNDCMHDHQIDMEPIEQIYRKCVFLNRESLLDLSFNDRDFREKK